MLTITLITTIGKTVTNSGFQTHAKVEDIEIIMIIVFETKEIDSSVLKYKNVGGNGKNILY